MAMSKAAMPPIQPVMPTDRNHPLFAAYMQHRNFCANNLITAQSFEGFVYCHERDKRDDEFKSHPKFKEFQNWMRDTKAGGRNCPAGTFPDNFKYWLNGNRW